MINTETIAPKGWKWCPQCNDCVRDYMTICTECFYPFPDSTVMMAIRTTLFSARNLITYLLCDRHNKRCPRCRYIARGWESSCRNCWLPFESTRIMRIRTYVSRLVETLVFGSVRRDRT